MDPACVATYRLQLGPDFGFTEAASITSYLADLGISHLYLSPCLQAAPGSTHGYDVVDPSRVSDALGGSGGYEALSRTVDAAGLGQLLDIVPNHMAIGAENPWWQNVLEHGPSSPYAGYFDVDWDPPEARLKNRLLLPVLPDQYGRVLEGGEIRVICEDARFFVGHGRSRYPLDPTSLDTLLADAAERSGSELLAFLADCCTRLPQAIATGDRAMQRRMRNSAMIHELIARACRDEPAIANALQEAVATINTNVDALDALLERQNFRLALWRTAGRDLGYRRFFDINSLAGLRVEDDEVFQAIHALPLEWVRDGNVNGLRVDHVDGLRNPRQYLERLRSEAPDSWIIVEKIVMEDEELPEQWPVDGTTGYEFAGLATSLLINPDGEGPLSTFYEAAIGGAGSFSSVLRESKEQILDDLLGSELNQLSALLVDVCERHRRHRDYTRHELHRALREVAIHLEVYRTYLEPQGVVRPADERRITAAIAAAVEARPDLDEQLFRFLGELLAMRTDGALEVELALRFQQLSGPTMAKGLEDTALYRYNRLVALNEVGSNPGTFSRSIADFHSFCAGIQASRPTTLLGTSTHDTKRSEDVRARLAVLSEIPEQWIAAVTRWMRHNERHNHEDLVDRDTEYLLYQTLVGAWPISAERLADYLRKAVREAKLHTDWLAPNERYEAALHRFVNRLLDDAGLMTDIEAFVTPVIWPGRINSLSQTLLKLTAPGIPDIYQGSELWELSLVDPDNRRPVDYRLRRQLLAQLAGIDAETVLARADEGLPKLWVIHHTLHLRRARPASFDAAAGYFPLYASGADRDRVVAFRRADDIVVAAPRLPMAGGIDTSTAISLESGRWRHCLTGERIEGGSVRLADLWERFPVALLAREEA